MIKAYTTDSATLKQYKGEDKYGTPAARNSVTLDVRIDYKNRQITNLEGETIVSMAKVMMEDRTIVRSSFSARLVTDIDIAYEDLLYFDGVDHAIIRIARAKDFRTRHMEVYVA